MEDISKGQGVIKHIKNMLKIEEHLKKFELKKREIVFKNRRDELVHKMTEGINALRVGTKYKPITKRAVALLINKNPFLAKDDDEVELLYKECTKRGNYKKFFWATSKK